jgi:hypothetical protein
MSRLEKLINDAIEALGMSPTAKSPVTKFDIMRIGVLIGHETGDEEANDCLMFLMSHKALGVRFSGELLTKWWNHKLGLEQDEALAPFQTTVDSFPSYPHTPQMVRTSRLPESLNHSAFIQRNKKQKGPRPVKLACFSLLQYLDKQSAQGEEIIHDSQFKHLVNECLMIIKENPSAQAGFQKAVDSYQDTQRRQQAKLGQNFAQLSRRRLEQTIVSRNQKLARDVEFLMRNQTSANKGSAVYFRLSPTLKPRRRSPNLLLSNPDENKRVQRILTSNL